MLGRAVGTRALAVAAVWCVACTSSTDDGSPVIDDVSPREGDYGTAVTVTGRNLTGASVYAKSPDGERVTLFAPSKSPSRSSAQGPILFPFAFPAEGEMTLTVPAGEVSLGSFTPRWTPGRSMPLEDDGDRVLGAVALGGDTAVLMLTAEGVGFRVFGAGEPRVVAVEPRVATATYAAVRTDGAKVEALVASDSGKIALVEFDGTTARATPYTPIEGSVLGIGSDASGFIVVANHASNIVRMRGAPPKLAIQGSEVPFPSTQGMGKTAMAVSGTGAVIFAWSGSGGSVLDETASFSTKGLGPTDGAFGAGKHLDSLDDTVQSLDAKVSGGVVRVSYCARDTNLFESPKTLCAETATLDGKATLKLGSVSTTGDGSVWVADGKIEHARCEGGVIVIGAAQERALAPCGGPSVRAAVATPVGVRLVVEHDKRLYVARRR